MVHDWLHESDCQAEARALAMGLTQLPLQHASLCIELHGPLGAGKTTFARHLLQALGVSGRIKSPSYAVLQSYEASGIELHHFDFYRFNDPQEWEDAGFRDTFATPGIKLVEWPQRAQGLLPQADLRLDITPQGEPGSPQRRANWTASSASGQSVLNQVWPQQAEGTT